MRRIAGLDLFCLPALLGTPVINSFIRRREFESYYRLKSVVAKKFAQRLIRASRSAFLLTFPASSRSGSLTNSIVRGIL